MFDISMAKNHLRIGDDYLFVKPEFECVLNSISFCKHIQLKTCFSLEIIFVFADIIDDQIRNHARKSEG